MAQIRPCGEPRPVLETSDLVVRFGGMAALDGVSLRVLPGDVRAIIGPNGAGKTTLFNAITGAVKPTSGRVLFRGQDITGQPPHRVCRLGISRTFQITNIFPELSVRENIWLGVNSHVRMPWNPFVRADQLVSLSRRVDELCELVGLREKKHDPASNLSHGDQRAVEIAIALSLDPDILLLDEPTQGVSPSEVAHLISLISAIAESTIVLLIEHNVDAVLKMARIVTVLDHGQIIAEGVPSRIVADRRVQEVYLGIPRG